MLFALAEVALTALLVGCVAVALESRSFPAACGAIAALCLLAMISILHVRLVRALLAVTQEPLAKPDAPAPTAHTSKSAEKLLEEPVVPTPSEQTPAPLPPSIEEPADFPAPPQPTSSSPTTLADEAPAVSTLDFAALSDQLVASSNPLAELKRFVGDIRTREAKADPDAPNAKPAPCDLERYAARMLEEAGLFDKDIELPALSVVRPHLSRILYLRHEETSISYPARQRILRLEAALNAIRFACSSLAPTATMHEAYLLNQGLARSIVAQAQPIDEPHSLADTDSWPEGEWSVRYGISHAIETLQLPHRLTARYRTNVADGNVAIEFDFTPAELFSSSCYVDGLGIVPSTGDMRQQAAADYALRLGLLLAASAFRCSSHIRHVWVAAILETPKRRTCYLSVDFDRWRFARIDLSNPGELSETYRSFAPVMRYEDGWLRPVRQGFHLEQERFCPTRRYLPVSLSSRRLEGHVAQSLGTDHVSGLAIEESDGRTLVANAIMMHLAPEDDASATQKNVKAVMELAGDDPDPTVREASERVVRGLVEGSLKPDALSVGEEFVRGDALTRACDRSKELLMGQKLEEAHRAIAPILARIDEVGTYDDSATVAYRYFNSYVERALYNRLQADGGETRSIMLVPNAYYEAHLLVSMTSLMLGAHDEALAHAERLLELAPLDARARLHAVKCLEVLGRDDDAVRCLCELLEFAYEPQGLGYAYYRMAFFQWKRGNLAATQACYQYAMRFLPQAIPMLAMELSVLYLQNPDALQQADSSTEELEAILEAHDIPLAPTEQTSTLFFDCARAALDAEVFPVARTFAHIISAFGSDDVVAGVIRSLEDEPDR